MEEDNFGQIIEKIRNSNIYNNPENWKARGLNLSESSEILILTEATLYFLDKLEDTHYSEESQDVKLKQISNNIDKLPWSELDTEEKEFMVDVLAPAIEASGFNPLTVF